jgi:hypothetical protein
MKTTFNEWITQNKSNEFSGLVTDKDLGMRTREDTDLLESQMEQWVNKLMGLLNSCPQHRKQELIEKVISSLQASIDV